MTDQREQEIRGQGFDNIPAVQHLLSIIDALRAELRRVRERGRVLGLRALACRDREAELERDNARLLEALERGRWFKDGITGSPVYSIKGKAAKELRALLAKHKERV